MRKAGWTIRLIIVVAALAVGAAAQVSLGTSLMFDTPLAQSATNANGQTYAVNGTTVYSITSGGSVLWARSFAGLSATLVAVDPQGVAYVGGAYRCTAAPCQTPTTTFVRSGGTTQVRAGQTSDQGPAIAKIAADGTLVYLDVFMPTAGDGVLTAVSGDPSGNAYVIGTASCGWPTTGGTLHPDCAGGGRFGFISHLNTDGTQQFFSTYIDGANGGTTPKAIVPDGNANVYVAGTTTAPDFPTTAGAFATSSGAPTTGFAVKIGVGGVGFVYSTLLPTLAPETIAIDSSLNVYVAGPAGAGIATTAGVVGPNFTPDGGGSVGAFAAKLNAGGSAIVYATYLGIAQQTPGQGAGLQATQTSIAVDSAGNAYIAGTTNHAGGPATNAVQAQFGDAAVTAGVTVGDGYIVELNPTGTQYLISSYLGGREGDSITGIGVGNDGAVYVGGATWLNEFPFTLQAGAGATGAAGFYTKFTAGGVAVPMLFPADRPPDARASNVGELFFGTSSSGTSITRRFHLGNYGVLPLTVGSVTASGDFSPSACPATLAPGAGCDISVTFQPTLNGTRTGNLTATTGSARGLATNRLLANAIAPRVGLSANTLGFGVVATGQTSAPQTLTVTNNGDTPLVISAVTIIGDYAQTSNCVTTLASGASCQVSVTFSPHTDGELDGTLFLTDNAFDSPQRILLIGGVAPDFGFGLAAGNTGVNSVAAGTTATYGIRVVSSGGFTGAVSFSCSGAPANATCSFNPTSATLVQGGAVNVTVSVTTTAHTTTSSLRDSSWIFLACGVPLLWLTRRRAHFLRGSLLLLVLGALLLLPGCGGDKKKSTDNSTTGTPAGSYTLTLTATSGSQSHTQSLVLVVQ